LSKNLRDLRKEDLKVEAIVNHSIVALINYRLLPIMIELQNLLTKIFLNYEHQKITLTDQDLINFFGVTRGL
jgi:hypothetical protein